MSTKTKTTIEVLEALQDSIATQVESLKTNASQTPTSDSRQDLLEYSIMFKEILLSYGYHIRRHQGHHPFRESEVSTNRNMNRVLKGMGYSEREIKKASPNP